MREEHSLTGPLEKTNEPYAIAKIAGLIMCDSYNRQHGTEFFSVMPTNLYGPNDNYDPMSSHVLLALIRRVHEAKVADAPSVEVWGTGAPRREFLYSEDMADAAIYLMNQPAAVIAQHKPVLFNIGCGEDVSIRELVELVCRVVGYPGNLTFDTKKTDGTPRKLLDVSRIFATSWRPKVKLEDGIRMAYADFVQRFGGACAKAG